MADRRPTILATGDVTADWSFIESSGDVASGIDMAWAWSEGWDVRAASLAGAAARVADMLRAAAALSPTGEEPRILGPVLPAKALASPLDSGITRTFSTVGRFPTSRTDRTPVWRISRFLGRHPAERFDDLLPSLEGEDIDVVAIHDLNLDYRRRPDSWRRWEPCDPHAVLLSTNAPFDDNELLIWLLSATPPGLLSSCRSWSSPRAVLPSATRCRGSAPPKRWNAAIRAHVLGEASRVVVQLELSGALVIEREGTTTLVFDPGMPEGTWMGQRPGMMPAFPLCYLAALALPLATGEAFEPAEAVRRAVQATRALLRSGLQQAGDGLEYPMAAVAEALQEDPKEIHATLHPRPDGTTSIIAGTIGKETMWRPPQPGAGRT
jgi:hypothetical protein